MAKAGFLFSMEPNEEPATLVMVFEHTNTTLLSVGGTLGSTGWESVASLDNRTFHFKPCLTPLGPRLTLEEAKYYPFLIPLTTLILTFIHNY